MNKSQYLNLVFQQNTEKNIKFKKNAINDNKISLKIVIIIIIVFILFYFELSSKFIKKNNNKYDVDFNYITYEKNVITKKIIKNAGWQLRLNQAYFINGLIRKYKPKKCLEIGVANGGSSILILNAIKDIPNSILVSLDLNKQLYYDPTKETGYRVKLFPELSKGWKFFTGDQPHKFLIKLNMKFDLVFLDTAHSAPGELLNFIELIPFLNENAIFVIHDILWHLASSIKFYPSNIYLFPSIYGDKVLLKKHDGTIDNIGAVFLYKNQENHYLDYFILLLSFWEYIPKKKEINDLRIFIQNYYKKEIFLKLFDLAVKKNIIAFNRQKNFCKKSMTNKKKKKFFLNLVYGEKK